VVATDRQGYRGHGQGILCLSLEWQDWPPGSPIPTNPCPAISALGSPAAGYLSQIPGVPHHQRFLVVAYDLHSKWPELTTSGSVTSQVIIDFLDWSPEPDHQTSPPETGSGSVGTTGTIKWPHIAPPLSMSAGPSHLSS